MQPQPSPNQPDQPVGEGEQLPKFYHELNEWLEWKRRIEDKELIANAKKMGVFLDDIPIPPTEDERDDGYYNLGDFGSDILRHEVRIVLEKKKREREPFYKKERREEMDFYIKSLTAIITAIAGLTGAAIGLFTVLKK